MIGSIAQLLALSLAGWAPRESSAGRAFTILGNSADEGKTWTGVSAVEEGTKG